jgi:hypothetical protein
MQLPWLFEESGHIFTAPGKWRVNIVGLGDVGGTLVAGLRLLGGGLIARIGLYGGGNSATEQRWEFEAGQIRGASRQAETWPVITTVAREDLFDCDMFVFCASAGVPPLGQEKQDVRLVQMEGNARFVADYARQARAEKFPGLFAVVSDPVDQLCYAAFSASNRDGAGRSDGQGLRPGQIRGYGLGVMHARAAFYAEREARFATYLTQGAAFGPHGQGLVIVNSLIAYDEHLSQELTDLTTRANLVVRATGFKPFVAPALSSGALSLLATMRSDWHYSALYFDGAYMGLLNRFDNGRNRALIEELPPRAAQRVNETHATLKNWSERIDLWMNQGMPEGGI